MKLVVRSEGDKVSYLCRFSVLPSTLMISLSLPALSRWAFQSRIRWFLSTTEPALDRYSLWILAAVAQLRLGPLQVCSMVVKVDRSTMDWTSSRVAISRRIWVSCETSIVTSLVTNQSRSLTRPSNFFESGIAQWVLVMIVDLRWCAARRLMNSTIGFYLKMSIRLLLTSIQSDCLSSVLSTSTPYCVFSFSASWSKIDICCRTSSIS